MRHREPATRAQQHIDTVFNGTGTITTRCQEIREIANCLTALGIPAGEYLLDAVNDIRSHAQAIAGAMGSYVGDQAEGRLHQKPAA